MLVQNRGWFQVFQNFILKSFRVCMLIDQSGQSDLLSATCGFHWSSFQVKFFDAENFLKWRFFLPKLKSCFYSFFVSLREFHDLEMLAYFITVSPIYGLLFSPFSAQCLASRFSCQDLGWSWIILNFLPGSWIFLFVGKILDFLDFLPRSWQLILPRNPRKIKILPRNPRPGQWNSEKKTTVVFITIN